MQYFIGPQIWPAGHIASVVHGAGGILQVLVIVSQTRIGGH
jgi:hypothetical protein